jgi:hypothetical protein
MRVTLMGPDDLGRWYLADHNGTSFPFVERHEDHPRAAAMLGWQVGDSITDPEAVFQDALDWLMDHTSDDFEAPPYVATFFRQLNQDHEE